LVARGARIDLLFTMSDNTRAVDQGSSVREFKILTNEFALERGSRLVEPDGIEPTTSCLQSRRSPN
jgi:hypothetical protein